jgi:hypothetical protein
MLIDSFFFKKKAWLRIFIAANNFITQESQNKVVANKSWLTVYEILNNIFDTGIVPVDYMIDIIKPTFKSMGDPLNQNNHFIELPVGSNLHAY